MSTIHLAYTRGTVWCVGKNVNVFSFCACVWHLWDSESKKRLTKYVRVDLVRWVFAVIPVTIIARLGSYDPNETVSRCLESPYTWFKMVKTYQQVRPWGTGNIEMELLHLETHLVPRYSNRWTWILRPLTVHRLMSVHDNVARQKQLSVINLLWNQYVFTSKWQPGLHWAPVCRSWQLAL
jgi:hypothetical protein